ncbi:PREDICTED: uncharacterized protein LOC108381725 [Rhagoletis zephyria]|uniref:uncharacterized protein LOC108381725 n=1 Tax=Rhagoletis zephyria TaxID=28612 RepID=UPI0008112396|nr:PREDICTED: uncharacterized protein LOC108381725 [Rhagoletis zephyria]
MSVACRSFKKLFNVDDFYKSVQPLILSSNLLGLTPFVLATDQQGRKSLQISRRTYFFVLLILAVYFYCCYYIAYCQDTFVGAFLNTDISNGGDKCILMGSGVAAMAVLNSNVLRKQRLFWALQYFQQIDEHFQRIGVHWNYTNIRRQAFCMLLIGGCTLNMYIMLDQLGCSSSMAAGVCWFESIDWDMLNDFAFRLPLALDKRENAGFE